MNITPTGTSTPTGPSSPTTPENDPRAAGTEAVSEDEFLRLLVAQLQNQDPLTPQDGTEFVAQLAQFASLEQAAQTNERLAALEATQAANLRAGFANLVGRTVVARADTIELPVTDASLAVDLPNAAHSVSVSIVNEAGEIVRTLKLGGRDAGRASFAWDGLDDNGVPLSPGKFRMTVAATAPDGGPLNASTLITAPVQSLDFSSGQVRFRAAGGTFGASDIVEIAAPPT